MYSNPNATETVSITPSTAENQHQKMSKVILVIGAQGCGKTTYIDRILATLGEDQTSVVKTECDSLRELFDIMLRNDGVVYYVESNTLKLKDLNCNFLVRKPYETRTTAIKLIDMPNLVKIIEEKEVREVLGYFI